MNANYINLLFDKLHDRIKHDLLMLDHLFPAVVHVVSLDDDRQVVD